VTIYWIDEYDWWGCGTPQVIGDSGSIPTRLSTYHGLSNL